MIRKKYHVNTSYRSTFAHIAYNSDPHFWIHEIVSHSRIIIKEYTRKQEKWSNQYDIVQVRTGQFDYSKITFIRERNYYQWHTIYMEGIVCQSN